LLGGVQICDEFFFPCHGILHALRKKTLTYATDSVTECQLLTALIFFETHARGFILAERLLRDGRAVDSKMRPVSGAVCCCRLRPERRRRPRFSLIICPTNNGCGHTAAMMVPLWSSTSELHFCFDLQVVQMYPNSNYNPVFKTHPKARTGIQPKRSKTQKTHPHFRWFSDFERLLWFET
jgi:hypothetical protein